MVANAGVIVTENVKDFPAGCLPAALDVVRPEQFATSTVEISPPHALVAVKMIASRSGRGGMRLTPADVLTRLENRYGMVDTTTMLWPLL